MLSILSHYQINKPAKPKKQSPTPKKPITPSIRPIKSNKKEQITQSNIINQKNKPNPPNPKTNIINPTNQKNKKQIKQKNQTSNPSQKTNKSNHARSSAPRPNSFLAHSLLIPCSSKSSSIHYHLIRHPFSLFALLYLFPALLISPHLLITLLNILGMPQYSPRNHYYHNSLLVHLHHLS